MSLLSSFANLITSWLKYHKAKTLLVVLSALVFFVVFFPFSEVAPRISAQLRQQVPVIADLDFSSLGISVTGLGIEARDVEVLFDAGKLAAQVPALARIRSLPPVRVDRVLYGPRSFWPSSFQSAPDAFVLLQGLAKGELSARFQPVTAGSPDEYRIEINAADLALREFLLFLRKQSIIPIQLSVNNLTLAAEGIVRAREVPKSALQGRLQLKGFQFPAQSLMTMMGSVAVPEFAFDQSDVEFKSELTQGRVNFTKVQLGRSSSPLSIEGKGSLALEFMGPQVIPTSYEFELEARLTGEEFARLQATVGSFAGLLLGNSGCAPPVGQSLSYRLSIQGEIPGPTRHSAGLPKVQCLR